MSEQDDNDKKPRQIRLSLFRHGRSNEVIDLKTFIETYGESIRKQMFGFKPDQSTWCIMYQDWEKHVTPTNESHGWVLRSGIGSEIDDSNPLVDFEWIDEPSDE